MLIASNGTDRRKINGEHPLSDPILGRSFSYFYKPKPQVARIKSCYESLVCFYTSVATLQ